MAKSRGDIATLSLLDWQAPEVTIATYPEVKVRAASLNVRLSKAVSCTLADARKSTGLSRDQVAQEMANYLGEDVSKSVVDAYASESRDNHNISLHRVIALMHATEDYRLLALIAEALGMVVIPKEHEDLLRMAALERHVTQMQAEIKKLGGKK